MHVIKARNVNDALAKGLEHLLRYGVEEPSRNGPVLVAPTPVTTVYERPWERVLFSPLRDANPFFHLMEALWMLAGKNDLLFPQFFNSQFGRYSDDALTLRGAYGYRWRHWFGYDQLKTIATQLRIDPTSRRAVLTMWDAGKFEYGQDDWGEEAGDLLAATVDKPCNTHIYFRVNAGRLDMTVCNRSNDIYWGAYGANAVHMSMLQEYMAAAIGVDIGAYYQVSNNFHLYTAVVNRQRAMDLIVDSQCNDAYLLKGVKTMSMVSTDISVWDADLAKFMVAPLRPVEEYTNGWFQTVAAPMLAAWHERKTKRSTGYTQANSIIVDDWQSACTAWILRREANKKGIETNG